MQRVEKIQSVLAAATILIGVVAPAGELDQAALMRGFAQYSAGGPSVFTMQMTGTLASCYDGPMHHPCAMCRPAGAV